MRIGETIGRLRRMNKPPVYKNGSDTGTRSWWMFCDPSLGGCGKEVLIKRGAISNGIQSCGCLRAEKYNDYNGLSQQNGKAHPLYSKWLSMTKRCYNPKSKEYINYGARGITVCQDWLYSYENFYHFAIIRGWKEGYDIDRFPDNDGNYQPCNVRFIPEKEHEEKGITRRTRLITAFGKVKTVRGWFNDSRRHKDVTLRLLTYRLTDKTSNWNAEAAIISPPLFK